MLLNCSTCFGRHAAHHQELKKCNCSLWFYIRLWLLSADSHDSCRQAQTYVKPEAAITVFELLMMGSVSPETCWAIKKHWNNKFYYTVASSWLFLHDLYYDARIHEHQVLVEIQTGHLQNTGVWHYCYTIVLNVWFVLLRWMYSSFQSVPYIE